MQNKTFPKFSTLFVLIIAFNATLTADVLSPSTYSATVGIGASVTVHKTLTVTQQSTAPVDVFLLTDTTGSMSTAISSVRSGFSSLVTSLSAIAPNIEFAVGEYKDVSDAYAYRLIQDFTLNTSSVQTALNGLSAGGGGDYPEANLYGLYQAATTSSFRPGSQRFLVWTGDAPGHDPSNGITQASATSALVTANAKTLAINVGGLDDYGQATAITAATGGQLLSGSYAQAGTIIQSALSSSLINYSLVALTVTAPAGVNVAFAPTSVSGSFNRNTDRTFDFDVTFTGITPGNYSFNVNGLVDGGIVASESDIISVTGTPEPSTWSGMACGLSFIGVYAWRKYRNGKRPQLTIEIRPI